MSNTVNAYLDALRRSGLTTPAVISAAAARVSHELADVDELGRRLIEANVITKWQHRMLKRGVHSGFFIGNHKLLGRIGVGGMSIVYLAVHTKLDRLEAVKLLDSRRVGTGVGLERFFRESRATASLEHPNVVRVYDYDAVGAHHYLVLEYIDGPNLQDLVAALGPLPVAPAARYMADAAAGLAFAHTRSLVHRDVKPGNLLVCSTGQVKVSDLGLARIESPDVVRLTLDEGGLLGTADYVSPEQAFDSHEVGPKADVYSLGAAFYFLLSGAPPFPGGTLSSKLLRHQLETPPSLRVRRPDVPVWLDELIQRMLSKSPAQRPTAEAVRLALMTAPDLNLPALLEGRACRPDSLRPVGLPTSTASAETRVGDVGKDTLAMRPPYSSDSTSDAACEPSSQSVDVAALTGKPLPAGAYAPQSPTPQPPAAPSPPRHYW